MLSITYRTVAETRGYNEPGRLTNLHAGSGLMYNEAQNGRNSADTKKAQGQYQ